MDKPTDNFLLLFPPVLKKVLGYLTFKERCGTLYHRSKVWRKLCLYGVKKFPMAVVVESLCSYDSDANDEEEHDFHRIVEMLPKCNEIPYWSVAYFPTFYLNVIKGNCDYVLPTIRKLKCAVDNSHRDEDLKNIYSLLTNLKSISIYCSNLTSKCVLQSLDLCQFDLHELSLKCVSIRNENLRMLLSKCLKLKVLKLKYIVQPIDLIIPENIQLRKLGFQLVANHHTLDAKSQKSIERLCLSYGRGIQSMDLLNQVDSSKDTLVSLDINCQDGTGIIGSLRRFYKLRSLSICLKDNDVADYFLVLLEIGYCKALKHLRFDVNGLLVNYEVDGHDDAMYDMLNTLTDLTHFSHDHRLEEMTLERERLEPRKRALYYNGNIVQCSDDV